MRTPCDESRGSIIRHAEITNARQGERYDMVYRQVHLLNFMRIYSWGCLVMTVLHDHTAPL